MRIALDYDGTYTRDPEFWDKFIVAAVVAGHQVVCVTQRFPEERAAIGCPVIFTSRQTPKAKFVLDQMPDVWIDDQPQRIFNA